MVGAYRIVKGTGEQLTEELRPRLIGYKKNAFGFSGLIKTEELEHVKNLEVSPADIESIMIYFEKERRE